MLHRQRRGLSATTRLGRPFCRRLVSGNRVLLEEEGFIIPSILFPIVVRVLDLFSYY
jgi:hypothetical protein